ncbi:hypothetical protein NM688_g6009 [Phlebia brevispora]|uniref:Uncharacterized protein n=1 Tax=Phlebia brevispora TaxID=194682 RepID=A0ACC1SLA7_9APHY|nr:hypothetical protein NM688_g6009 [Phlebia brevispora]
MHPRLAMIRCLVSGATSPYVPISDPLIFKHLSSSRPHPLSRDQAVMSTETRDEQTSGDGGDAWAMIDKTVRNVDEDKVKDCTDDIDTLLVFAGLYSGILTAFLIESYKALQEDPQDVMVQLLRQSATQSYVFNGRFLNSTSPILPSEPYQAPTWAIRVNVCWFFSLVLSLSTASYGILVKQWLREYLAIDRISHQERIRIRHFRHQGIKDWRLYDIAAVLPVILQISLALFFLGLCFFTAAVHSSIGITSAVLVSAWAAFIVFAILAPLFSSRCPFKTPLLQTVLTHIRPRLLKVLRLILTTFFQKKYVHDATDAPNSTPEPYPPSEQSLDFSYYQDFGNISFLRSLSEHALKENIMVQEEVDVRNSDANDLIIFRAVDSIFLDDDLLANMVEALKRRPPSSYDVFRLVVTIIQSRLDIHPEEVGRRSDIIPWPWALSHNARILLINMLANSLLLNSSLKEDLQRSLSGEEPSIDWIRDAVFLIFDLSSLQDQVPTTATLFFRRIIAFGRSGREFFDRICEEFMMRYDHSIVHRLVRYLTCMTDTLITVDVFTAMEYLEIVANRTFSLIYEDTGPSPLTDTMAFFDTMQLQDDNSTIAAKAIVVFAEVAITILHKFTNDTNAERMTAFPDSVRSLLAFLITVSSRIEELSGLDLRKSRIFGGIGLDKAFSSMFMKPNMVQPCLEYFAAHSDFLENDAARTYLMDPMSDIFPSRDTLLKYLNAHETFFKAKLNTQTPLDLVSVIRLCVLVYQVPCSPTDEDLHKAWHSMYSTIAAYIRKFYPSPAQSCASDGQSDPGKSCHLDTCQAARAMLQCVEDDGDWGRPFWVGEIIHSDDASIEDLNYSLWLQGFDISFSFTPDALFNVLRRVICPTQTAQYGRKFWRIRRLEDMHAMVSPFPDRSEGGIGPAEESTEHDDLHTDPLGDCSAADESQAGSLVTHANESGVMGSPSAEGVETQARSREVLTPTVAPIDAAPLEDSTRDHIVADTEHVDVSASYIDQLPGVHGEVAPAVQPLVPQAEAATESLSSGPTATIPQVRVTQALGGSEALNSDHIREESREEESHGPPPIVLVAKSSSAGSFKGVDVAVEDGSQASEPETSQYGNVTVVEGSSQVQVEGLNDVQSVHPGEPGMESPQAVHG